MACSASVVPKLKDYVLTDKLGSGTYAAVYKAYKKNGKRDVVAIKCVRKDSLNRISTENLLTEIELLKTLHQENIVELKDFQWDDSYVYIIMEYCSGGDLAKFIQSRRTLSEHSARRLLQQLAMALQYMRKMNVSHLDLKPQNILLSSVENPILKVGDFGFAHYLIGDTDAPFLRGSLLYMAPEIIIKRQYNEKADLWSVGVILYECLHGRTPFASQTIAELEQKIKDTRPVEFPLSAQISPACRHLLSGLLQRDPEKRMSFEEFFAHKFVDLEHRPSSQALNKATELTSKAVELDKQKDYNGAVKLYCQALEYFMAAIRYENNFERKEILRAKVQEYMRRAEQLKVLLKPKQRSEESNGNAEPKPLEELMSLSADNPPLLAALTVILNAEKRARREDFNVAMEKYELALESLMKLLPEEPTGRRKQLLQRQISRSLSEAEEIKKYIHIKDLQTEDTSNKEEEEQKGYLSQCCVQ